MFSKESKKRIKEISNRINKITKRDNKKELSTQDIVKKFRKNLNEMSGDMRNRKTVYDQSREESNFKKNFDDLNVSIDFIPLEVYDNLILWGGTVDGMIQFVYKVTRDDKTSGVEFNYLDEFTVDNPDNDEIIERIENYYDQFYRYWRDNIF